MIFNKSKICNKMGLNPHEDICDTGLCLGLSKVYERKADTQDVLLNSNDEHKNPSFGLTTTTSTTSLEPVSLTLGFSDVDMNINKDRPLSCSPNSGLSNSFSNTTRSAKREKELVIGFHEDMEVEKVSSRVISDEDDEGSARKKLRLTKEQSALLEESFKEHSTLNPKQKQALAKQLNLRARQVEVWFQNRRARTKLKQTEVDCEFLKKCCETLTAENRRLYKELQELKGLKLASAPPPPMYMQLPATTLTMCPSCERIGGAGGGASGGDNPSKNSLTISAKSHIYNPFNRSSATY